MNEAILVLILLLPNGQQEKIMTPEPTMDVCQLEVSKAYRKLVNSDKTFVIYCKRKP